MELRETESVSRRKVLTTGAGGRIGSRPQDGAERFWPDGEGPLHDPVAADPTIEYRQGGSR